MGGQLIYGCLTGETFLMGARLTNRLKGSVAQQGQSGGLLSHWPRVRIPPDPLILRGLFFAWLLYWDSGFVVVFVAAWRARVFLLQELGDVVACGLLHPNASRDFQSTLGRSKARTRAPPTHTSRTTLNWAKLLKGGISLASRGVNSLFIV